MMLSDLIHAFSRLWTPPAPTRTTERKLLTVPIHNHVDHPEAQPVLAAAADIIANSGIVYKWLCHDGSLKLCSWDSSQKLFIRGSITDWLFFIGDNWKVRDTDNIEYRGPSFVVTDRLIGRVLAHPATPVADWRLQEIKKKDETTNEI
jgi:hypothetical protein